jgi:hypothetical protein
MNLSEMIVAIRKDLHDQDISNYRWTDIEIDRHIRRAVSEFSEQMPLESKATKVTTLGSRDLDIADITNRVMVEAVEYPVDRYPRHFQPFSLWGDTLTIIGDELPEGSDASIYYGKLHSIDAGSSTIPTKYEDLIAAGAAGYAAMEWAVYAVNRVNSGGTTTPKEFLDWGNQRIKYFRDELRKLGRKNRVRISSIYVPSFPVGKKSTDYGPV